jgi:hypothetical protein
VIKRINGWISFSITPNNPGSFFSANSIKVIRDYLYAVDQLYMPKEPLPLIIPRQFINLLFYNC